MPVDDGHRQLGAIRPATGTKDTHGNCSAPITAAQRKYLPVTYIPHHLIESNSNSAKFNFPRAVELMRYLF